MYSSYVSPSNTSTELMAPLSPSHAQEEEIIVKVHYTTTRALVMERNASFKHLEEMICEKFARPLGSVSLW